jgi:hypothetical protein
MHKLPGCSPHFSPLIWFTAYSGDCNVGTIDGDDVTDNDVAKRADDGLGF